MMSTAGTYASYDFLTRGPCEKCGKELTRYHKFWECESQHMTCYYCFADQIFHDLTNKSCPCCAKDLKQVELLNTAEEHVFIYVDDSNMWIEAKKLAALKFNFKSVEDPRLRLDIGKVTDVVAGSRHVAWGTLYGSEPPPIDTVWRKIRDRGWKVITTKRSTITNKEKQVDHQMVTDITTLVSDRSLAKGKVVIVSGDADMIPAIRESLKMKWSIEIWMWERSISNSLKRMAEENPELLNIFKLDSSLEDVTFTSYKFGEKELIPKSRSAIIKNIDFSPDEKWQKSLSEKLGWPLQVSIGPAGMNNPVDHEDIILIFPKAKSADGKSFENVFQTIFETLKQEYPGKVVNYPAYREEFDKEAEICTANKFEALEIVDEQLSLNSTSSKDPPYKHEDELLENEAGFQVVGKQRRRKTQQYSELCEHRSTCKSGLNCKYRHTNAEKRFFKNPSKDTECPFKGYCKYGPERCYYTHSDKDGFCRNCHKWGHLQEKCRNK